MIITLWKCSVCGKHGADASNMKKHAGLHDGTLEKVRARVLLECDQPPQSSRTIIDIAERLRDRVPTYDDGDDERIDHTFATGFIRDLLTARTLDEIPAAMFRALWSREAPRHLQSLVLYRNCLYEITSHDPETGDITYEMRGGGITKKFLREFAVYTLDLAESIARNSVPLRTPDLQPAAARFLGLLKTDPTLKHKPRAQHTLALLDTAVRDHVSRLTAARPS